MYIILITHSPVLPTSLMVFILLKSTVTGIYVDQHLEQDNKIRLIKPQEKGFILVQTLGRDFVHITLKSVDLSVF